LFFVLKASVELYNNRNTIMDDPITEAVKRMSSHKAKEDDESKRQRTSSNPSVHLRKRCGLGDACKNPNGELAARYKCEECRIPVHPGICGLTGDPNHVFGEEYWCPTCLAKVKQGPAAHSSTEKSTAETLAASKMTGAKQHATATTPTAAGESAVTKLSAIAKDAANWKEIVEKYKSRDDIILTGSEVLEQVRCSARGEAQLTRLKEIAGMASSTFPTRCSRNSLGLRK